MKISRGILQVDRPVKHDIFRPLRRKINRLDRLTHAWSCLSSKAGIALLVEAEKKGTENMEALVFAIIVLRKGFKQQETLVPETAEFRPFDLRALSRLYEAEADSSSKPSDRQKSLVTQIAS